MNLPNFECVHLCPPFWELRRHASLHHPLSQKYLKAPEINWKIILHWLRFQKKKAKSVLNVINSYPCSTEETRCEFEFRLLILQDETIATDEASAGFILRMNLFALWFSFFTQEQRPFYHDKKVNIKPSKPLKKPPCFKKPLTVLRAGSCVLSHCEQFGLSLAWITKFVGTHTSTTQTSGSSTASSIICQNELSVL